MEIQLWTAWVVLATVCELCQLEMLSGQLKWKRKDFESDFRTSRIIFARALQSILHPWILHKRRESPASINLCWVCLIHCRSERLENCYSLAVLFSSTPTLKCLSLNKMLGLFGGFNERGKWGTSQFFYQCLKGLSSFHDAQSLFNVLWHEHQQWQQKLAVLFNEEF